MPDWIHRLTFSTFMFAVIFFTDRLSLNSQHPNISMLIVMLNSYFNYGWLISISLPFKIMFILLLGGETKEKVNIIWSKVGNIQELFTLKNSSSCPLGT